MFIHHPDGYIVIDGIFFPIDFFKSVEKSYVLHSDFQGRIYIPSVKHVLIREGNSEVSLENTWSEGDAYIGKKNYYISAYETYLELSHQESDIVGIDEQVESY